MVLSTESDGGARRSATVLAAVLGVLVGAALQMQQSSVWGLWAQASAIGLSLAGLAGGARLSRRPLWETRARSALWSVWPIIGSGLAGVLIGWGVTDARAQWRLSEELPTELEGVPLVLTGRITQLPQWMADGVRFEFVAEQVEADGLSTSAGVDAARPERLRRVPRRLLVTWVAPSESAASRGAPVDLTAGQRWRLPLRLKRPHGLVNPHGFDRELWLFEQGWRATASVRTGKSARAEKLASGVCCAVERWRDAARSRLRAHLGTGPETGVLAALILGDQGAIDSRDWTVFRQTGVAHLMAISGLHITALAWWASRMVAWAWRRHPRWALRWPAPWVGDGVGLVVAMAYAWFAGWGVPAQRTVWMLAVWVLGRRIGWRWPGPTVALLVAGVVVVIDPWSVLQAGFWLSFVAVWLLMGAGAGQEERRSDEGPLWGRWRRAVQEALHTQWIATVGLAPWTVWLFGQFSWVGLPANLLAVPWVTIGVTPLALAGLLWPPCWEAAAWLVGGLRGLLTQAAQWPLASQTFAASPWGWSALGGFGALLVVLPLPWRVRTLGVVLLVPMLWPAIERPAPGTYTLMAVDIGQGNAVWIRTATHDLLYDTGPAWGTQADAGDRVLVPLLSAQGVQRLDAMVLSHRDSDHTGGAGSVLHVVGAELLYSSLEAGHPLLALVHHAPCVEGMTWVWDGVRFEFLHPTAQALQEAEAFPGWKPNARSCVLRIGGDTDGALLVGDIEREQELTLLNLKERAMHAEVLLVPHHGSKTSSSAAWLRAVSPRWAVIQAGYRNRYGHPATEVLQRYRNEGIAVIRSDLCGAWRWDSATGRGECERVRRRRYWHAPVRGSGPEVANPEEVESAKP